MTVCKHEAIYALHPSVTSIHVDVAYDSNGAVVEYDNSAVETEAKLIELRRERDAKLSATDWWASSDLTMTTEQTAYRQALRDITETYTSVDDVVWPTKP